MPQETRQNGDRDTPKTHQGIPSGRGGERKTFAAPGVLHQRVELWRRLLRWRRMPFDLAERLVAIFLSAILARSKRIRGVIETIRIV